MDEDFILRHSRQQRKNMYFIRVHPCSSVVDFFRQFHREPVPMRFCFHPHPPTMRGHDVFPMLNPIPTP
jgi:hypothetical protein